MTGNLFSAAKALLETKSPETRSLDYKQLMYDASEGGRKEFAKDVSAFANAYGGLLIVGVAESAGVPERVIGLDAGNVDEHIRWMESVLRSWISPHVLGLRIEEVTIDGKALIVVDVPRGGDLPYEVSKAGNRFFIREERSVRTMSREELRSAIRDELGSQERVDQWVEQRWNAILGDGSDPGAALLPTQGGFALTVSPITRDGPARVPIQAIIGAFPYVSEPHGRSATSGSARVDGVVYAFPPLDGNKLSARVKIFRNGCVEVIDGYLADFDLDRPLPGLALMRALARSSADAVDMCSKLTGAGAYRLDWRMRTRVGQQIAFYNQWYGRPGTPADRDELVFDPLYLNLASRPGVIELRPLFDQLWQSFGYIECGFFGDDGKYTEPR